MATERTDGGPAFPAHEQWSEWSDLKGEYVPRTGPRGGMSLRDWFAGMAMAHHGKFADATKTCAAYCYQVADAMLLERAK